MLKGWLT